MSRHEESLHCFNLVMADEAARAAEAVDAAVAAGRDPGPLAGVPVALKDNLCTHGIPTTCSSQILEGLAARRMTPRWSSRLRRSRRHRHRQDEPR